MKTTLEFVRSPRLDWSRGLIVAVLWLWLGAGLAIAQNGAPSILTHPASLTVSLGAAVRFEVVAVGESLVYRWRHGGVDVPEGNSARLVIPGAKTLDAGEYDVVVSNPGGSVTSQPASLTVDPTFLQAGKDELGDDGFLRAGLDVPTPSWVDDNGDQWLDVVVVPRGGGPRNLEVYQSDKDGTFTRIQNGLTRVSGLWEEVTWGDVDADGDLDGWVAEGQGLPASLFVNQANLGTEDFVRTRRPVPVGGRVSFADYNADGWVDVFVTSRAGSDGAAPGTLFHNRGGPLEVRQGAGLDPGTAQVEAHHWVDYDGDGDVDLHAVTSGTGNGDPDLLFQNQGNGTFLRVTDHPLVREAAANLLAGWADYDNDGDLDVFLPYLERLPSALYRNTGSGTFEVDAQAPVLNLLDRPACPSWGDFDNDGDLDLFVTQENGRCRLFANDGLGKLTEIELGSPTGAGSLGSRLGMWADYNNDGFLDLLVTSLRGEQALYVNRLATTEHPNHWVKMVLKGTASNPNGLGAKIRVKAVLAGQEVWQMRELGGSSLGADLVAHFGLRDAATIPLIRVEWPSGNVQELVGQAVDQWLKIEEPLAITPSRPSANLNASITLTRSLVAGASYQWRFNGVDLPGKISRVLSLTGVTPDQAGRYSVVVTTPGSVVTNSVALVVEPQFSKITQGSPVADYGEAYYASAGDYDNDGDEDLMVGCWRLGNNTLYVNNGDGSFTRRTSGLPLVSQGYTATVLADFDNDGWLDYYAPREGGAGLFGYNRGDGTFEPVAFDAFYPWNACVVDYDRDGRLDLYLPNGDGDPASTNRFYRNLGHRNFQQLTEAEIGPLAGAIHFGPAAFADYDDDGWPDVYVGNDLLYRSDGRGRFVKVENAVTREAGWSFCMAWGDYNNDGRADLAVGFIHDGSEDGKTGQVRLYRNRGGGQFEPEPFRFAVPTCVWVSWADYDNDGFLDLSATAAYPTNFYRLLAHNNGDGTFSQVFIGNLVNERPSGVTGDSGQGSLWFDYDNDGFLDFYVLNPEGSTTVPMRNFFYRNQPNGNHWLKVKLIGTRSNPRGVGAKVRLQAHYAGETRWQRREITAGDLFNGHETLAHFGLGEASSVLRLRIEWPSGTVEELAGFPANQTLRLVEPSLSAAPGATGVAIRLAGNTNAVYAVEASANFKDWTVVTNTPGLGPGAAVEMVEPIPEQGHRFYRVK